MTVSDIRSNPPYRGRNEQKEWQAACHSLYGGVDVKKIADKRGTRLAIFLCLLPALAIYTYVVVVPIIDAVRYSFFNWSGGPNMKYIGLKNYQMLLKDKNFWAAFLNNIKIMVICVIGQIGIAFIFSAMLSSRFIKLKKLHRVVAYFPSTLSAVVVGFTWSFIFNYDYGLINVILRALGMDNWAQAWLNNPDTIIGVVCIPLIWQYIGYYMVIIMAAMSSIDPSIYEMAELDGAGGVQRALKITLPIIKNSIGVAVMLCIAGNMKIFDHIYVMTNGGPGTSSMVMALQVYKTTFVKNQFGYASAMSIAILILSLAITGGSRLLINRPWRKEKDF